jgi:hypothetical protein
VEWFLADETPHRTCVYGTESGGTLLLGDGGNYPGAVPLCISPASSDG